MTRKDDELTLRILDMLRRGYARAAIARTLGTTPSLVKNRIARVKSEDCLHDPTAHHWWRNIGDPNR